MTDDEKLRRLEEAYANYLEALRERNAALAEVERLANAESESGRRRSLDGELDADLREIWRNR